MNKISTPDFRSLFESTQGLYLVLLPDLTITAVSDTYLQATMTKRENIVGHSLFEIFPDNPDDITADGVSNLRASLDYVLTHKLPHTMAVQKYDIRRPDGVFEVRYWQPYNKPVLNDQHEVVYIIHNATDVTNYKEAEEHIRLLATIAGSIQDPVIATDNDFRITRWNGAAEKLLEWKTAEVIGKTTTEILHAEFLEQTRIEILAALDKDHFWQGEVIYHTKSGRPVHVLSTVSRLKDADGNITGSLVMVKDITERKTAEEALFKLSMSLSQKVKERTAELEKSEKRFRALVENNEGLITLIDDKLNLIFRSASAERLTGWSNEEYNKRGDPRDFVHPDDLNSISGQLRIAIDNPGMTVPGEMRLRHKDGHYISLEGTIKNMMHDPAVGGIITNMIDVTHKREAEQKILKANRLYFFISQVNQMIVRTTEETELFKEACRIAVEYGKFQMAWIGRIDEAASKVIPVMHAGEERDYLTNIKSISLKDIAEGRGTTGKALKEGRSVICNDIENDPQMAKWKEAALERGYLSTMSVPIKKFGKVTGVFSFYAPEKNFFDAEEIALLEEATGDVAFALENFDKEDRREKAEAAVLESKLRYETLTEVSPVGIFHTDEQGHTTYVNPRWCDISGMTADEALGYGWLDHVHKDDQKFVRREWINDIQLEKISLSEFRFVHPDGSFKWVMGQALPERNAKNKIVGYVGTTTDITERKIAEEEIKKLLKEKETVLNRINDGMVSVDENWRYTFLNDAALSTHPLGREETIGQLIWDVHPELKGTEFGNKYEEAMNEKKVVEIENYYPPMHTWFSVKVYPSHDGLTIFYRNITEEKKAAKTIKENEERIELIYNTTRDALFLISIKDGKYYFSSVNNSFLSVTGLKKEQVINKFVDKVFKEPFLAVVLDNYKAAINGKKTVQWEETSAYRILNKTGIVSVTPVFDDNGECIMLVGSINDITELKKIQNEIITERNLSDTIINSLPGIFYLYNQQGQFLRWNRNFETVSKYKASEIRKMHPLDFFDEADKALLIEKIGAVFVTGEENVQADFLLKTKEKIPYYFTGVKVDYKGIACLMGVGIDFSERQAAQEKINEASEQLRQLTAHLQNVTEEERRRIGREIHDELGQQLTAIKMDVSWINKKIPEKDEVIKTKLKTVISLLDGSNQSIRRILTELRPSILDEHGLIEAMEWLSNRFTTNTGVPLKFTTSKAKIRLSEALTNSIFRVYQEALTNITRYAKASSATASLKIIKNVLTLIVEDDGKGFDTRAVPGKKSFGILGMKERVHSINGKFELISAPGKGTKIIISIPL